MCAMHFDSKLLERAAEALVFDKEINDRWYYNTILGLLEEYVLLHARERVVLFGKPHRLRINEQDYPTTDEPARMIEAQLLGEKRTLEDALISAQFPLSAAYTIDLGQHAPSTMVPFTKRFTRSAHQADIVYPVNFFELRERYDFYSALRLPPAAIYDRLAAPFLIAAVPDTPLSLSA